MIRLTFARVAVHREKEDGLLVSSQNRAQFVY